MTLSKEDKKQKKEACLAVYYERVMRLFEAASSPHYVIATALEATRLLPKKDEKCVSLYGIVLLFYL